MKEFKCHRCKKALGEMTKGKIHKEAVVLCDGCIKFYEQCDSLMQINCNKNSMPDFINDIFGKKDSTSK